MRSLMFIVLVSYAVKCDDASYYVIEIPEEPKQYKPFSVYWNVPTMQCRSKKIPFTNLFDNFGIIQNNNDSFRGEKIAILYDPGLFPALLKNETSGKFKFRNGGVPQEGDLEKHLAAFRTVMEQSIPDPNFKGIGIIDFESWRPVFRQNFGVLIPYKDISYQIERKLHWFWPEKSIQARARQRFEDAGRLFMASTLSVARQMRPHARWGYYAFPYCFNMSPSNKAESCADGVAKENDNIRWLWAESTALFPSAYFSRGLSAAQQAALVRGRVAEAARAGGRHKPVLPYFWFRYRDGGFLPQEELNVVLETLYKSNASGFIIWGSSNDVNTVDKCQELLKYTEKILGPSIAKYTKYASNSVGTTANSLAGGITTWRPNLKDHLADKKNDNESSINPDYHWDPPENYTQDIVHYVENEMKTKNLTSTGDYDKPQFINIRKNTLIEFLFNILAYDRDADKESNIISSENINTANVVTSTPKNELVENSYNENVLAVNSFTTKSPLLSLLKNQKKGIPMKISTTEKNIRSTTIIPNLTSLSYSSEENNFSDINPNENLTSHNVNSIFVSKNESTSEAPAFDLVIADTTESSYNYNLSIDSSARIDNSTQNILDINATYDELDKYTSQIDYISSSTDPTNFHSILNIKTKPITTKESVNSKSQLYDENSDKNFENISLKFNENEFNLSTENKILKTIQEYSKLDIINYTTISETSTEPMEFTSDTTENTLDNETQTFDSENSRSNEKNEKKGFYEEVKQTSTKTDESTTENDVFTLEDEYTLHRNNGLGEDAIEEPTTNAVRQVVVLY